MRSKARFAIFILGVDKVKKEIKRRDKKERKPA